MMTYKTEHPNPQFERKNRVNLVWYRRRFTYDKNNNRIYTAKLC